MKHPILMLCLCSAVIATLSMAAYTPARAVEGGFRLTGLGLHQDTGRDIYLGGIYLRSETARPENFNESTGPRIMEYRIIARRTSMRSLLGSMLLQSQIATDKAPDTATANFIDTILSAVNQSLYAGDSLEIELTRAGDTVARLNGLELARVANARIANYLLMGWVGEAGPSTIFREAITSGEVNPSLLAKLEANTYTAHRQSEIGEWLHRNRSIDTHDVDAGEPAAKTIQNTASEADATETPSTTPSRAAPIALLQPVTVDARYRQVPRHLEEAPEPAVADTGAKKTLEIAESDEDSAGPVQIASLEPVVTLPPGNRLEREVRSLGLQEYFQRLGSFHSDMVRRVYGKIRYPRRAVRRSLEGRLELDITMTGAGELLGIQIVQSSGHRILDDAAVSAARAAFAERAFETVDPVAIAEFGDFDSGELTVPVPVNFRLE